MTPLYQTVNLNLLSKKINILSLCQKHFKQNILLLNQKRKVQFSTITTELNIETILIIPHFCG